MTFWKIMWTFFGPLVAGFGLGFCNNDDNREPAPDWSGPNGSNETEPAMFYKVETEQEFTGLFDVWVVPDGGDGYQRAYATGSNGTVLFFDGLNWIPLQLNQSYSLYAVWGRSLNDVWFGGTEGALMHWNGLGFTSYTIPSPSNSSISWWRGPSTITIYDIWGSETGSNDTIYAIGGDGISITLVIEWNGVEWIWKREFDYYNSFATLSATLGISDTSLTLSAGQGSIIPSPAIPNSLLTIESESMSYTSVSGDTVLGLTRGVSGTTASFHNSGTLVLFYANSVSFTDLNSVFGFGPSQVWFSGYNAAIWYWDGASLTKQDYPLVNKQDTITAMWGSDASSLYAVGNNGTIIQYNNGTNTWLQVSIIPPNESSFSPPPLWGIHGVDKLNFWVTGERGLILHYYDGPSGIGFYPESSGTGFFLRGIRTWGNIENPHLLSVGGNGVIIKGSRFTS